MLYPNGILEAARIRHNWQDKRAAAPNRDWKFTRESPTLIHNLYSDGTLEAV
jgi:hypothetical protein